MELYTATDGKVFADGNMRNVYNDFLSSNEKQKILSLAWELLINREITLLQFIKTLWKKQHYLSKVK